jgi:SAM-dependent methyltransferase
MTTERIITHDRENRFGFESEFRTENNDYTIRDSNQLNIRLENLKRQNQPKGQLYGNGDWHKVAQKPGNARIKYIYPEVQAFANSVRDKKVYLDIIDVGCGAGEMVDQMKINRFDNYVGVDYCPENVRYANAIYGDEGSDFVVGDGNDLEAVTGSRIFDQALEIMTMHHLDYNKALKSLRNVMKDGSELLIIGPNSENIQHWKNQYKEGTLVVDEENNKISGILELQNGVLIPNHSMHIPDNRIVSAKLEDLGLQNVNYQIGYKDRFVKFTARKN